MNGELTARFALAIVCDALAFVVMDVGTRPPVKLVRDIAIGLQRADVFVRGVVRVLAGLALLVLAFLIARPGFPTAGAFLLLQTAMLVAGLVVENLIGPDARRIAHRMAAQRTH